jgi:hypothetical protein
MNDQLLTRTAHYLGVIAVLLVVALRGALVGKQIAVEQDTGPQILTFSVDWRDRLPPSDRCLELAQLCDDYFYLEAFLAPPIKWTSPAGGTPEDLRDDMRKWAWEQRYLVPEARVSLLDWAGGDKAEIDVVVTNEHTGAQYYVSCQRSEAGVNCAVRFIGNKRWYE